jgi:ankyrin repeat protein
MRAAKRFHLESLMEICEKSLVTSIHVRNCVKFYQTADEIGADILKNHCSELISSHWNDFTSEDFVHMTAPLLFKMFKSKTKYPLHTAIRIRREDVVFLYLIEYNEILSDKVNEIDDQNDIPLDLALKSKQQSIADNLLQYKANVNTQDEFGLTLLHRAVERRDLTSIAFLLKNHASVDIVSNDKKQTSLHLLCALDDADDEISKEIAVLLLDSAANPNLQDANGNTCLHLAVLSRNFTLLQQLLQHETVHLEVLNQDSKTPLAIALRYLSDGDESFARTLVDHKAQINSVDPASGDTLLHRMARDSNMSGALFLLSQKAKANVINSRGESPLHFAAVNGLLSVLEALLQAGADPSQATRGGGSFETKEGREASNQIALHLAVMNGQEDAVQMLLKAVDNNRPMGQGARQFSPLNWKDSLGRTPLMLALQLEQISIVQMLIDEGSDVDVMNTDGFTMLHQALINGDTRSAMLLLNYGADVTIRTPDNRTPLKLAVNQQMASVVVELCSKGAEKDQPDSDGNTCLWNALENGNEDIASFLVQFDCDTNYWTQGPGKYMQNYLHRALDENNQEIACFLIRSGCDVNSARRPLPELDASECDEEANDGLTPLHLACTWNLDQVVQTLLEHGADVNSQDSEGRCALHIAIANKCEIIMRLLLSHPQLKLQLRNKYGQTPFAIALEKRENKAAQAILDREPSAAEKVDAKGRNFLHNAILKTDLESVLFLLSVNVNIHSRVQDNLQMTALHLAVQVGSEMIVRNLLLADVNVNELNAQKQSVLHVAAENGQADICSILLEHGVNVECVDLSLNNALHIACSRADLDICRVLIQECNINAEALNLRGQNPLHLLCQQSDERATEIFQLFLTHLRKYPVNKTDAEGNSPLLLAYVSGNAPLCKLLVANNACLGTSNKLGVNIFNSQVASKTLLYRLLDQLPQESPWTEGDQCQECGSRFGLTSRKHHCRHCGRLLCARCSALELPIPKFNLTKPVRICEVCNDVLSLGFSC